MYRQVGLVQIDFANYIDGDIKDQIDSIMLSKLNSGNSHYLA